MTAPWSADGACEDDVLAVTPRYALRRGARVVALLQERDDVDEIVQALTAGPGRQSPPHIPPLPGDLPAAPPADAEPGSAEPSVYVPAASLTIEFDPVTLGFLGRPNFTLGALAERLRECGVGIAPKAEAEQAAGIHALLDLRARFGADWAKRGTEYLNAIAARRAARAAQNREGSRT